MSKAILKFNLSDQTEKEEYLRCLKADDMASVIWEFLHNSRKKIEQEFETKTEGVDVFDGIERSFEHFYRLLKENNVNIDEIWR